MSELGRGDDAAASGVAAVSDDEVERLLHERDEEEGRQVQAAVRRLGPGAPCPVCGEAVARASLSPLLAPFVRQPPLRCARCPFASQAAPSFMGWALAMALAVGLALGGMSAIFSAQRVSDPRNQKVAFLGGALLFGGGLFLGYGVHGAASSRLLEHRALGLRRRRAEEGEGAGEGDAQPARGHEGDGGGGGWFQENLEAVVVAIILALIIRHFVMEAFVIPTGSMAPTLHGDHFAVRCGSCGYEFAAGMNEGELYRVAERQIEAECPLCDEVVAPEVTRGDVQGGHKILVNKFLYEARPPQRFDVIVFKYPKEPWKNYIKRLVGLPGESVQVRNGDIYVDGAIARKPDHVQDALWIPVYDSAYRAGGWRGGGTDAETGDGPGTTGGRGAGGREPPRWRPVAEAEEPHAVWSFEDDGRIVARPELVPDAPPTWAAYTRRIYDSYGYNRIDLGRGRTGNPVADLRVRARVVPAAGAAVRLAVLESSDEGGQRVVSARFPTAGAGSGRAGTFALEVDGEVQRELEAPALVPGRAVEVTLAYADDRARLQVDGETIMTWDDPFAPDFTHTSNVRLAASGAEVSFEQVRIDRDIYYLPRANYSYSLDQPRTVPAGSYLVLGDNSPNSEDGRAWGYVREGHVIGRAFLVFWPLSDVQRIR